ncbi:MAG TPA: SAM-dependent methyltransferase [Steroidobacteraceae bacterium]|nr:SAM-dependent methyltransferase [Steroidobacteraceae bacterium]
MTASAAHSILPPLSVDEERHSRAAAAFIRQELVAAGGWLPFDRFMELCLYAPGLGYYSAGSVKLGAGGDFVTAPEASDLFSRCLARQCQEILQVTGGEILELGAGTGRMAAVILECLAEAGQLPERYAILEVSADLAERQRGRLQHLPAGIRERVVWLERLPSGTQRGVILANEVLDALPFQRFMIRGGRAHELGVALDGDAFVWRPNPQDESSASALHAAPEPAAERAQRRALLEGLLRQLPAPLPEGYMSEVCPIMDAWVATVGQCLEQGVMLLFDYGLPRAHYYHPQRHDGTLRCHFRQRAHDNPFINISVQDITAWVDFTRVAEAAVAAGLDVSGFATQAAFLLGTGIENLVAGESDAVRHASLAGEARRLLLPAQMGESFKVMALGKGVERMLCGFIHQDLRASL